MLIIEYARIRIYKNVDYYNNARIIVANSQLSADFVLPSPAVLARNSEEGLVPLLRLRSTSA